MKKSIKLISVFVCVLFMGCAALSGTAATIQNMTPKQQAIAWLGVYNNIYDDTLKIMSNPASTPEQKNLGRKKTAVLKQVWPLLKGYTAIVDSNGTPTADETTQLTDLINQLEGMI